MERQPKILIVDDDPDIVDAIRTVLESQSYQVVAAYNGEECLQAIRREVPDLVILDLLMPKKDGFAVIRELKEDPRYGKYSRIPVMILTSVRQEASQRRYQLETGLALAVDDYAEKPVPPKELLRRVDKLLSRALGR